ncbi:hypothetical protein [Mesorhizobium sp. 131-3-5]|uniref:hypothetical protein n=1 Tax=Mesorhizobium sp. 131-3-5 TaxID=2744520 RepID=UPI0019282AA6|nr:hypothetical protein [Mesorhizobium sp. 131-3-5]
MVILTPNFDPIADAEERIRVTELALQRTEEMLAENIALSRKMRCLVDAADQEINTRPQYSPAWADHAMRNSSRRRTGNRGKA